jgi:hypothetical protein
MKMARPDSETVTASTTESSRTTTEASRDGDHDGSYDDPGSYSEHSSGTLTMTQCPECDATAFVAKKLVYEEFEFDADGRPVRHRPRVRAEFEYTCRECGRRLRELPPERRTYYSEVHALEADLDAAVRRTIALWLWRVWSLLSRS